MGCTSNEITIGGAISDVGQFRMALANIRDDVSLNIGTEENAYYIARIGFDGNSVSLITHDVDEFETSFTHETILDLKNLADIPLEKGGLSKENLKILKIIIEEMENAVAEAKENAESFTDEELRRRAGLCIECTDYECAYNDTGICAYALVKGKSPKITEKDGCHNGVFEYPGI